MAELLKSISEDLMIPKAALVYLIRSSPYRYKVYEIDKRSSNKKRIIAQPAREVKSLQYWVMEEVLRPYALHPAAMAYRKGRNIRNNAEVHADRRFLLKMDFKDFFHSISSTDFIKFLAAKSPEKFSVDEVDCLCRILFWNKGRKGKLVLSIGAPSSPLLSNLIMYDFDSAVRSYCRPRKVRYTRYADDLTFSTNTPSVLEEVEQQIAKICRELSFPKLRLNRAKTIHASKAGSRRVTGLVLSNEGTVSIGRKKKRELQAEVHHFVSGDLDEDEIASLKGMLAFVRSIDPGFIDRLRRRYSRKNIEEHARKALEQLIG